MAEPEPQPQPSVSVVAAPEPESEPLQYWCYQCDKRVSIETQADESEIICYECKSGFVESIRAAPLSEQLPSAANGSHERSFSHQFLQVLRLLAQAARDEDTTPPPAQNASETDDFLRIELDGWHNDVEDDDDDEDDEDEIEFGNEGGDRSENDVGDEEPDEDEGDRRRRRRDILRLRIRDFGSRAPNRRNRILDWSEIRMGLEENAIELRIEMPDSDGYFGNPEDYVDAAGYEALLQNLAESDGARKGAPPAAKSAVLGLKAVEVAAEGKVLMCAICKEAVGVGNIAKELPCGHGYHGECIDQWLDSRNSCPVCRFELPTDDADYEEERKKKLVTASPPVGSSSTSSSSGENNSLTG